jgi:hypothetical protein
MRRFILGLLTLLALASLADAGGLLFCRRCRRCHAANVPCAVAVAAEVVREVPVAQFVPIQVPTYSVTYTPIVQQITRQETFTTVPVSTQVKTTTTEQSYGPPATVLYQASGQQVQGVAQVQQTTQGYAQQAYTQGFNGYVQQPGQQSLMASEPTDQVEAALMDYIRLRKELRTCQINLTKCLNPTPAPLPGPTPGPPVPSPPGPAPGPAQPMSLAPLTPAQILDINKKCYSQAMPKGGPPLNQEEMNIVSYFVATGESDKGALQLFTNKCAACHADSVSTTKGGPNHFTLLQAAAPKAAQPTGAAVP